MSVMSSARRKLLVGAKPGRKNYARGDYKRWLESAKAQLAGLFNLKEYYKHRTHQKALIRENSLERERRLGL